MAPVSVNVNCASVFHSLNVVKKFTDEAEFFSSRENSQDWYSAKIYFLQYSKADAQCCGVILIQLALRRSLSFSLSFWQA